MAICQGSTSSAMGGSVGGSATGGTWSGGAGTWKNANDPANATYTASASESGIITLTLTTSGGSCGTKTATKTITVKNLPTISGTYTLCEGSSTTLIGSATAHATTPWTSANPSVATIDINGLITSVSSGTSVITYMNTDGCTKTETVTIYDSPSITTNITNNKCANDFNGKIEVVVTGGKPNFEYNWSTSTIGSSIITNNNNLSVQQGLFEEDGVDVYVKDANGCISNKIVGMKITSPAPLNLNNHFDTTRSCFETNTGTITINPQGGVPPYTYDWQGTGVLKTAQNQSLLSPGFYRVTVKDKNNCELPNFQIEVKSHPEIKIEAYTLVNPDCFTDLGKIVIDRIIPNVVYKYKIDQENFQDENAFRDLQADNEYLITVKNTATGCEYSKKIPIGSTKDRVSLSTSSFDFKDLSCSNKVASITYLNPKPGYTYFIENSTTPNASEIFDNLSPGNYKIVVKSKDNCTATSDLFVVNNVLYSAKPNSTQIKRLYCDGEKADKLVPTLNSSYVWYDQQGFLLNTNDKLYDGIYTVSNKEVGKCESEKVDIDVDLSRISLSIISVKSPTCNKSDGEITAKASNSIGNVKYVWMNTDSQVLSNNPKLTGIPEGYYILEATDEIGCKATTNPPINMTCSIPEIPQLVTPNGDGKNDTWIINYKSSYPRVKVQIYNRWGNLVYESQPYDDDWDGTSSVQNILGNKELPTGTYFYIIDKQSNGEDVESGYLELVK